jgi:hypothetical protein
MYKKLSARLTDDHTLRNQVNEAIQGAELANLSLSDLAQRELDLNNPVHVSAAQAVLRRELFEAPGAMDNFEGYIRGLELPDSLSEDESEFGLTVRGIVEDYFGSQVSEIINANDVSVQVLNLAFKNEYTSFADKWTSSSREDMSEGEGES